MCVIASPNCMPEYKESSASNPFSLKDLIGDGILWAVPKHRKSIERRLKAKYGHPKYHMKIMSPKTTLRTCMQCGHDHEVGVLCRKCYFPKKTKTTETSYQTHICVIKNGLHVQCIVVIYSQLLQTCNGRNKTDE